MANQQLNLLSLGVGALQLEADQADPRDWCWLFSNSEMCARCMQEKSNYYERVCFEPLKDIAKYPKMAAAIWQWGLKKSAVQTG